MHRMDGEYRGHGPGVWYGEAPQQQDVDQVIAKRSRPESLGKYLVDSTEGGRVSIARSRL